MRNPLPSRPMNIANLIRIGLAGLWVLSTPAFGSAQDYFSVGGFHLHQSPKQLKAAFPLSIVDDTNNGEGRRESVDVSVDPREARDYVASASYSIYDSKLESLQIGFARLLPPGKAKKYYANPLNHSLACDVLLKRLGQAYGKPAKPILQLTEEDMTEYYYVWEKPDQVMLLVCGRYKGDKAIWSMGLMIKPTKEGACGKWLCRLYRLDFGL